MSASPFQNERKISLVAPDGVGPFLVTRFSGTEALGRLFEYDLSLVSEDPKVDFTKIVAQPVTLVIAADDRGGVKMVDGYVSRFAQTEQVGPYMQYHATVVPYVWFLSQGANCQIIPQPDTVPAMVKKFLSDLGFDDVEDDLLTGHYPPREYCVQYRETNLSFISRLLEEEGILYHFEHRGEGDDYKHVMVLTDAAPAPAAAAANVLVASPALSDAPNAVTEWAAMTSVQANSATLIDFDFKTCNILLASNDAEVDVKAPDPLGEIVDHPGEFAAPPPDSTPRRCPGQRAGAGARARGGPLQRRDVGASDRRRAGLHAGGARPR